MPVASVVIAAIASGGYISIVKVIFCVALLLLWARLLTWVDKDAAYNHMPREIINLGLLGGLILGFALLLILPGWMGIAVLILTFLADVGAYLGIRHQKMGLSDLQDIFKRRLGGRQSKKEVVSHGQVIICAANGQHLPPPEEESPQRLAYDAIQSLLAEPLKKNAELIEMQPSSAGAAPVRCVVDGMPYAAPAIERNAAAAAVGYLKWAAAMDLNEHRKPQSGLMKIALDGNKHELEIGTSGSGAGEFLRVIVDPKKRHALKLEELGLSPDQLEKIQGSIRQNKGIVLVAAPRGGGLTSMLYAILRSHDAFLQQIQTIERGAGAEPLEVITQNRLAGNAAAPEEAKILAWVISQEPDVLLIDHIEDSRTAPALIKFVSSGEGHRVYVGLRAGSTFEALKQWRKLVGDDRAAINSLHMVIAGRLLRRLCMACKQAFAPDAQALRRLNVNIDPTQSLFQARTQPLRDSKGNPVPCEFCRELHYTGRSGIFEVMMVDDELRKAVQAGAVDSQLIGVFRKQKGRLLQESALALVEKGLTSVQEVVRVMKAEAADGLTAKAAPGLAQPQRPAK